MIRLPSALLFLLISCSHSGAHSLPRGAKTNQYVLNSRSLQNNVNKNKVPTASPTEYDFPTESPYPSPSPSAAPTRSAQPSDIGAPVPPTLPPSTSVPSKIPSQSPSQFPSTARPSKFPSMSPSVTGIVGFVNLTFSLLAEDVTAASVRRGRNQTVITKITNALLYVLCEDTEFVLLDNDNGDSCATTSGRRMRELQDNGLAIAKYTGESIIRPEQVEIVVDDISRQGFNFTGWLLMYPLLHVGIKYEGMSDDDALQAVQSVVQSALAIRLEDGDLDNRIDNIGQTSTVGQEHATWTQPYYEPLQPTPLHPLRIAGIALFLVAFALTFFVTTLAKQRRIEREWDAEFKERGMGGLVTEEGLDLMLEAGRNESMAQQKLRTDAGN